MKILEVKQLILPEVRVVRYQRFKDNRGYFTEVYRRGDFDSHPETSFIKGASFIQSNEGFSKKGTIRGLHFQWNPYQAKLVRTIRGHMVDLFMDIRKGSPTFGKIAAYEMPSNFDDETGEWIWIPVGFAHGNFFSEDTVIEYYCTGAWSPECEAGISPFASDIDWSLCDSELKSAFDEIVKNPLISEKDRSGFTLAQWTENPNSNQFIYAPQQ